MKTVFFKRIFLPVLLIISGARSFVRAAEIPVLDSFSNWRIFSVLKVPDIQDGNNIAPAKFKNRWLDADSQPVPADWNKPELDDYGWLRGPITFVPDSAMVERIYLRGKFTVTNPFITGNLTLAAEYQGGIIVYLNGEEVGRANVAKGIKDDSKSKVLAEKYPPEAFLTESGAYLSITGKLTAEDKKRRELWGRSTEIKLPSKSLKKGVNVLSIEVIRSAYDKAPKKLTEGKQDNTFPQEFCWSTCLIKKLLLSTTNVSGLVPDLGRPQGLQVWNADIMQGDYDVDFGSQSESLKPVSIIGPRNGIFSGKVNAGSTNPIRGLSARAGDLKGPSVIPVSAIRIRYGVPWGRESWWPAFPFKANSALLASLSEKPLKEYPVGKVNGNSPAGAVAPIWVTIKIPKDAQPGLYTGALTVQSSIGKDIQVPLELKVLPWVMPDQQDYRTWVDLTESPDTLAVEYNLPLWSEKHFKMIGDSFELISGTGSRIVYISALAHTNLGNEESMIRWIKKPNNKYDWDFSIMEKYLDAAQKNMGNPKAVVLQVWEIYMRTTAENYRFKDFAMLGTPEVTFFDPATKKTEFGKLPPYSGPGSKAAWKELIEQVQARLKKRGLENALMLGMFCDAIPQKEDVEFFLEIAPKLSWFQQGHQLFTKIQNVGAVGYNASVWGGYRFADGGVQSNQTGAAVCESLYGWNNPRLDVVFERNTALDEYFPSRWYFFPETGITSELRGIGRIGADYWKAVKDKTGRRADWVHSRYREGSWAGTSIGLVLCNPVLAPGLEGPEATNRLIALTEGVEACEARIFIEKALMKDKARLGPDLSARCQAVLDERLFDMWRSLSNLGISGKWGALMWRWGLGYSGHKYFLGSEWQKKSEKLFAIAGEVEQKIGKKK